MYRSKIFRLDPTDFFNLPIYFDPDTDPKPESYTKEQVEQIVQGRLSKLQDQLTSLTNESKKKDASIADFQKHMDELKSKLPPSNDPPPPPPHSGDVDGRLKILENKYKTEVEGLKKQVDAAQEAQKTELGRRRKIEKEREIQGALMEAGCRADAIEIGQRTFDAQITFNEDEEKWDFNLKGGGVVSIRDGVIAELPDFLKDPTVKTGGSGSKNGSQAKRDSAIKTEADRLEKLKARAETSGAESDILAYLQQERKVKQLQKA